MFRTTRLHTSLLCLAILTAILPNGPLQANQLDSDEPISIDLKSADLAETLRSFATVAGSELDLDERVEGEVTISEKKPWPGVLDQICRDHELNCEQLPGDPPTLRVRPAKLDGAYPSPPGFADNISMSLKGADLMKVLESFTAITGQAFEIADDLEGNVTIEARSMPWTIMLEEVCRLSGCNVIWDADPIRIEAVENEDDDEAVRLNMALRQAELRQTLGFFSHFPIFSGSGPEVEIDPSLTGTVTVDFENATWRQSLDMICEQVECAWHVIYGDPPVLKVTPLGEEEEVAAAGVETPGAAVKKIGFRFSAPGGTGEVRGAAALSWAEPIHVVSQGAYQARLHWIPFGPKLSVVLPLIERCEAGQSAVSLLHPIVLPLTGEALQQAEGASLVLHPAAGSAEARPSAPAGACGAERAGEIYVTMHRLIDGEAGGPRPKRIQFVESSLLVRPVEATGPVAAVIALGGDLEGRQSLALVQPTEDGSVDVTSFSLRLDEHLETVVRGNGHAYALTITYSAADPRER